MRTLLSMLGIAVLLPLLGLGCFSGERGEITLAYSIEDRLADQVIIEAAGSTIEPGREFLLRLEVPELREESFVMLRASRRTSGTFQSLFEFEHLLSPPWKVAVIPVTLERQGEWLLSVFASSRKLTDVTVKIEQAID